MRLHIVRATNIYCMDLMETCLREASKSKLRDRKERWKHFHRYVKALHPFFLPSL